MLNPIVVCLYLAHQIDHFGVLLPLRLILLVYVWVRILLAIVISWGILIVPRDFRLGPRMLLLGLVDRGNVNLVSFGWTWYHKTIIAIAIVRVQVSLLITVLAELSIYYVVSQNTFGLEPVYRIVSITDSNTPGGVSSPISIKVSA